MDGSKTYVKGTSTAAASETLAVPSDSLWRTVVETPRIWAWEIAASIAVAVWFGLVGPFGSYEGGPLAVRLMCFLTLGPGLTIVFGVVGRLAVRIGRDRGVTPWLSLPLALAVASGPVSVLVAFVVPLFLPRARFATEAIEWYLQTLAVVLPSGFIELLLRQALAPRDTPVAAPARGAGARHPRPARRGPLCARADPGRVRPDLHAPVRRHR